MSTMLISFGDYEGDTIEKICIKREETLYDTIPDYLKENIMLNINNCNDKSLVFPPPVYNSKHVYMYIVVWTNKIIYANVTSHAHRHTSWVHKL